jgi:hypothetical protein
MPVPHDSFATRVTRLRRLYVAVAALLAIVAGWIIVAALLDGDGPRPLYHAAVGLVGIVSLAAPARVTMRSLSTRYLVPLAFIAIAVLAGIVGYLVSDDPLTVAVGITFAELGLWFWGPLPGTVRRPG